MSCKITGVSLEMSYHELTVMCKCWNEIRVHVEVYEAVEMLKYA